MRSDLPDRMSSTSLASVGIVILGSVARRKPRSVKICVLVSRMVWSMVSAITERPYTFLRWLTGTLPGRKPLSWTLSLRSTSLASALASRSDAGTLIWNSCFKPSARVSVTCMASIFFPLGPASAARTLSIWSARGFQTCAGGSAAPFPAGNLPLRQQVLQQSSCKRRQRLVRAEGLEPPQLSSLEPKSSASTNSATPADQHHVRPQCPGMIAEKCEAVFGRPIMLQVNGINRVYDLDTPM